jgi:hypothetical protein
VVQGPRFKVKEEERRTREEKPKEQEWKKRSSLKISGMCPSFPYPYNPLSGTRREAGGTYVRRILLSGRPVPKPAPSGRIFLSISLLWQMEK